jgi:hypothetical protein
MSIFLVLLTVTAAVLMVAALRREIGRDGYGYRPPPRSHAGEDERVSRLSALSC